LGDAARFGELRQRLAFLIGALVVYRVGTFIPVPGIDPVALDQFFQDQSGTILTMFNMFSGGALERLSIFALGIMPYISASIIMQMATHVVPALGQLRKEGESGRRKITQYTRYGTVVLSTFQAMAAAAALQSQGVVLNPGTSFVLTAAMTLVAGTTLYKVTRNKKDMYVKDERALNDYLLRSASEHSRVVTPGGELGGGELKALLEKVIIYEDRLQKQAKRRDARVVDALVQAGRVTADTLSDEVALAAAVERMYSYFSARMPDVMTRVRNEPRADPEHHTKKLVFHTEINGSMRETVLDHAFLSSPEYLELVGLREAFGALGRPPYAVKLEAGEVTVYSVQEVLAAVRKDAQKGLGLQRYKGLGEMNPEQLWDTTMNPATRTLLQVQLKDAVESDEIFSLLMGEAVEPRREFIERNALDVQNLDI
jgi:hypothetical protein